MLSLPFKSPIVIRFVIAAVAFMFGIGINRAIRSVSQKQNVDQDKILGSVAPRPDLTLRTPAIQSEKTTERISQSETVTFPRIGSVRVCAHEDVGQSPKLVFIDVESGKELLTAYVGTGDWKITEGRINPQLRFKLVSMKGLPPMIVGVGMSPGASDSAWESVAVGVVNGELEQLTFESLQTSNYGGFFFGDLGQGLGVGAAQWDFVWGEGEGHPPPHQYELRLFKWNGRRFEWYKVIRTRKQYESDAAALKAYGFHFVDIRGGFPDWPDVDTW